MCRIPLLLIAACGGNEIAGEGSTLRECKDGEDNDANGLIDCDDPGCADTSVCKDDGDGGIDTVTINEFMASNASTLVLDDKTGSTPDWIELFNPTDEDVVLDGYTITDDLADPGKHPLDGLSIETEGFLLLYADGDPELGLEHLSFKLARTGEDLGLSDPDGVFVTQLEYGEQVTDQSAARIPDASDNWQITTHPTPGESNRE